MTVTQTTVTGVATSLPTLPPPLSSSVARFLFQIQNQLYYLQPQIPQVPYGEGGWAQTHREIETIAPVEQELKESAIQIELGVDFCVK